MLFCDGLTYALAGLVFSVFFGRIIFGVINVIIKREPPSGLVSFLLVVAFVFLGFMTLPIDPRFNTCQMAGAGLAGAIGGGIGAILGLLLQQAINSGSVKGEQKKSGFASFLPVLGLIAGFAVEKASSGIIGDGLANALQNVTRVERSPSQTTAAQVEIVILQQPVMAELKASHPTEFRAFINKMLEFAREAEREGKRGEQRYATIFQKAAIYSDSIVPKLPDALALRVLEMRIGLWEEVYRAGPPLCLNPMQGKALPQYVQNKFMSQKENMLVSLQILGAPTTQSTAEISDAQFQNDLGTIKFLMMLKHPDASQEFFNETGKISFPDKYCKGQVEFLKAIKQLKTANQAPFFKKYVKITSAP